MPHPFPDDTDNNSEIFSSEGVGYCFSEDNASHQSFAYMPAPLQSIQPYPEQNGQVMRFLRDPYAYTPGLSALSDNNMAMSSTSTGYSHGTTASWMGDNTAGVDRENMTNNSVDFAVPVSSNLREGHAWSSEGGPSDDTPYGGLPAIHSVSCCCCHRLPATREPVGGFRCHWRGCTNTREFTHDGSLWRHIKAKHLAPDAYKCPACKKTFGRKDKWREHCHFAHGAKRSGERRRGSFHT